MAEKTVRVKVVVEVAGKDVATEYVGYETIQTMVGCRSNWQEPPVHQALFKYLVHYPHSSVQDSIASYNTEWEVFEILLARNEQRAIRTLITNDTFLKKVPEEVILKLIESDSSLACEIAGNLNSLQENINVDINTIIKALVKAENHEIDNHLAGNSSFKKTVSKMLKHPDPSIAALARDNLK